MRLLRVLMLLPIHSRDNMKIVGKCLTIEEFRTYVEGYNFGSIPPNKLILHHTYSPTIKQWKGKKTLYNIKSYYENELGWSAGPHLFIAEDGIWLFTPMFDVGIHAATGNATWTKNGGRVSKGYGKPGAGWKLQEYSIGIEVVGEYDTKVWSGKTKDNAVAAIKILMDNLNIDFEEVKYHSDYSKKTCPGLMITRDWLLKEVWKYNYKG